MESMSSKGRLERRRSRPGEDGEETEQARGGWRGDGDDVGRRCGDGGENRRRFKIKLSPGPSTGLITSYYYGSRRSPSRCLPESLGKDKKAQMRRDGDYLSINAIKKYIKYKNQIEMCLLK